MTDSNDKSLVRIVPPVYGVSVIVCCYNSSRRLEPTLASLASQHSTPELPWEVIVVDNASTDSTADVARAAWPGNAGAPLRVVRENKPGLSHARNCGLQTARYEYVSFIDDDNWVCADWVRTIASIFDAHADVGMCGGTGEPVFEATPPAWFFSHAVNYAVGAQGAETGYLHERILWGAGLSIRLSAWRALVAAGFSPRLSDRSGNSLSSGGDTELCVALTLRGWRQWFDGRLLYRHFIPASRLQWRYMRRLYRGFGASAVEFEPYLFVLSNRKRALADRFRQLWIWRLQAAFRDALRNSRKFWRAWRSGVEGDAEVLRFEIVIGRVQNLLGSARSYGKGVRAVRDAAWRRPDLVVAHESPVFMDSEGVRQGVAAPAGK